MVQSKKEMLQAICGLFSFLVHVLLPLNNLSEEVLRTFWFLFTFDYDSSSVTTVLV